MNFETLVIPGSEDFFVRLAAQNWPCTSRVLPMSMRVPVLAGVAAVSTLPDHWLDKLLGAVAPSDQPLLRLCVRSAALAERAGPPRDSVVSHTLGNTETLEPNSSHRKWHQTRERALFSTFSATRHQPCAAERQYSSTCAAPCASAWLPPADCTRAALPAIVTHDTTQAASRKPTAWGCLRRMSQRDRRKGSAPRRRPVRPRGAARRRWSRRCLRVRRANGRANRPRRRRPAGRPRTATAGRYSRRPRTAPARCCAPD